MHGQCDIAQLPTAPAASPPVTDVEAEGLAATQLQPTPDTGSQFRPQSQRRQALELQEDPQLGVGRCDLDIAEGSQGKSEEGTSVARHTALRHQTPEQIDQITTESETGRLGTQPQEWAPKSRASEIRHSLGAKLKFDLEVVHQIEASGKALDALARALRHCGHTTEIRSQQVDDLVPLPDIHHAQQDRLGLHGPHATQRSTAAVAVPTLAVRGVPGTDRATPETVDGRSLGASA